jgi:hypothetical protein
MGANVCIEIRKVVELSTAGILRFQPSDHLDSLASLGYFRFKECPGMVNPTIGIEVGQTYTFIQTDRSNWYHPMGFAYFPDGDHDGKDELEPTITQTGSNCPATNSCPSPRYFRNDAFLGLEGTADFGLDVYEPEFFLSLPNWAAGGERFIQLNFNDDKYGKDIFYFCHVC